MMISGGGTGGHIYPAISIAQALKETLQHVKILFVGAKGKMEMDKIPEAGFEIEGLWITGIQRKITAGNLMIPFKLYFSIVRSYSLLRKFKPDVVIGTGGYASGPLLYAATRKKIPTLIQEQNSYAGLTNKWLAKKVDKICVAHEGMEKYFPSEKIAVIGNPVRKMIKLNPNRKSEAFRYFEIEEGKPTLLVIGGSLGARTINESVLKGLKKFKNAGIQLIWQCGRLYHKEMEERMQRNEGKVILKDFIFQMDFAYACADVVISRSGALAIAELMLTGKPSILVPSSNVAEDHQTINSKVLVDNKAAEIVKDNEAMDKLTDEAIILLNDKQKQEKLSKNIHAMAHENATMDIANEIMKLVV